MFTRCVRVKSMCIYIFPVPFPLTTQPPQKLLDVIDDNHKIRGHPIAATIFDSAPADLRPEVMKTVHKTQTHHPFTHHLFMPDVTGEQTRPSPGHWWLARRTCLAILLVLRASVRFQRQSRARVPSTDAGGSVTRASAVPVLPGGPGDGPRGSSWR